MCVLYLAGLLSANLALVNILPFPPLDGGRMLVIIAQGVPRYGTRITLRAEQLTYAVGFVVLFAFLIWITVFDIAKTGQRHAVTSPDQLRPRPAARRSRSTSGACWSAPPTRSSSSR